jgi:hypothetical protein
MLGVAPGMARTSPTATSATRWPSSTAFDEAVSARRRAGGANPNEHWFAMLKYTTVFGYCTSEVAMRRTFGVWPRPSRYDGCAPVGVREG